MPHTRIPDLGPGARHNPTLYAHPEDGTEEDGIFQDPSGTTRSTTSNSSFRARSSYTTSPASSSGNKNRSKQRPPAATSSSGGSSRYSYLLSNPRYSTAYSHFNQKYRSTGITEDGDQDIDGHYFHRYPGQNDSDSDDDTTSRRVSANNTSGSGTRQSGDPGPTLTYEPESWPVEPQTAEDKERMEWQTMLTSVLDGEVLRSEKTRIVRAIESYESQRINRLELWYGLRAKVRGRTEEHEKERLAERRLRTVGPLIEEILQFRVPDSEGDTPTPDSKLGPSSPVLAAIKQVANLLRRWDIAESLYPNLKAMRQDNPASGTEQFIERVDALNCWFNVVTAVRGQVQTLRKWTGSETLDINSPSSKDTVTVLPLRRGNFAPEEHTDSNTFVERILKEDGLQRIFEKGALVTVHGLVFNARTLYLDHTDVLGELNLPSFTDDLLLLISFPTRLMGEVLRIRVEYVSRLIDPSLLSVDQMLEDLRLAIGLACTLKNEYDDFMRPDLEGKWDLPPCIGSDYEDTILHALRTFFSLIHKKLKSNSKGIYFKETELLEAQWGLMEEVTMATGGGGTLVAEHACRLANRLIIRAIHAFKAQLHLPAQGKPDSSTRPKPRTNGAPDPPMSGEDTVRWYSKVLDAVKLRQRKLARYSRLLLDRFGNSAEYSLEGVDIEYFISTLVATEHFLIYTEIYEARGIYIVGDPSLYTQPDTIRQMLSKAFHVPKAMVDGTMPMDVISDETSEDNDEDMEDSPYLLVLSPTDQFVWRGTVLMLGMPIVELELGESRARLIAPNPGRLKMAREKFAAHDFLHLGEDEEVVSSPLICIVEQQAHLPPVNRQLQNIDKATDRLAIEIVDSAHTVHPLLSGIPGAQELMENWFMFASDHGQTAFKHMDNVTAARLSRSLTKLAITWVAFICDDCDPTDRKTFRWAVNALEFTMVRTRGANILQLPEDDYTTLRQKVASCMTLLISHFDILGARSSFEAKKEEERVAELRGQQALQESKLADDEVRPPSPDNPEVWVASAPPDRSVRLFHEQLARGAEDADKRRELVNHEQRLAGTVLLDESPDDRSIVFLAASSSNMSIRWQQGRFIGAGAFGSVYMAINTDTGGVMAAKEIRFKDSTSLTNIYKQVKDELSVMELLHHPNIVEYYGIEVHRDKIFIFEEYCSGGTLAQLLELGRIEDETVIKVYTMQMLEGLIYLHSQNVVHRDIKPDNILLDHNGIIKFVDFGAAKVLAKNQRSMQIQKSISTAQSQLSVPPSVPGLPMNSLTGTPMYMSPESIKNDRRGRRGAMDIWSLGCVVLECATGRKPWSNLDNEWAIMFHIGVATKHPALPEPGQLSELGINFIKQCLIIDPMRRPTAEELYDHPWMASFRDELAEYEDEHYVPSTPSLSHSSFRSDAYDNSSLRSPLGSELGQVPMQSLVGIVSPTNFPAEGGPISPSLLSPLMK